MATTSTADPDPQPAPLSIRIDGRIARLTLQRPEKRNALNDRLIEALGDFFASPPPVVRVAVLAGAGGHFSAGLDLSEHVERPAPEVMRHSRAWHGVMDAVQLGGLPVVAVLEGAVIGGGLELAAACHVRVAEPLAIFQLPEGRRGIFVGGGTSVRIGRIIGADRLVEIMLTGRTYTSEEAVRLGLAHYQAPAGEGLAEALRLAQIIAGNARLSNEPIIQALVRIDDMGRADGLFTESLCAALAQSGEGGAEGFFEKRRPTFD
jgi:enoyl-CoA hydratase/carnithine racemase